MASTRREELERRYHKMRDRCGMELHRFVRLEEDEARRFQRRFQVHSCLMCFLLVMTVLNMSDVVSVSVLAGTTFGVNSLQEAIDKVGRF